MEGVAHLYDLGSVEKGLARVSTFDIDTKKDHRVLMNDLRAVRDGHAFSQIMDGHYVRLHVDGKLMMSDTHMERRTNVDFVRRANGRVLVAGLGVGLIIHNILNKENVTEIIVIEKYQDVIDLVSPKFNSPKLKIICDDIFQWKPEKGEKFDTIYFDIWTDISTQNLYQIKILHNKFKFKLNRSNPNAWMDSWVSGHLRREHRRWG